jgi:hypothetical protein
MKNFHILSPTLISYIGSVQSPEVYYCPNCACCARCDTNVRAIVLYDGYLQHKVKITTNSDYVRRTPSWNDSVDCIAQKDEALYCRREKERGKEEFD